MQGENTVLLTLYQVTILFLKEETLTSHQEHYTPLPLTRIHHLVMETTCLDDDSASDPIFINPIYGGYDDEEENVYADPKTSYKPGTGIECYNKETENVYSDLGSTVYNCTTGIAHSTSDTLPGSSFAHKRENIPIIQGAHARINTTVQYMSSSSSDGDKMSDNDSIPDVVFINPIYGNHDDKTEKVHADPNTNQQPGMGMESCYDEIENMNAESDFIHQPGTEIDSCYDGTGMESSYDEIDSYADPEINHQTETRMEYTPNFSIYDNLECDEESKKMNMYYSAKIAQ